MAMCSGTAASAALGDAGERHKRGIRGVASALRAPDTGGATLEAMPAADRRRRERHIFVHLASMSSIHTYIYMYFYIHNDDQIYIYMRRCLRAKGVVGASLGCSEPCRCEVVRILPACLQGPDRAGAFL